MGQVEHRICQLCDMNSFKCVKYSRPTLITCIGPCHLCQTFHLDHLGSILGYVWILGSSIMEGSVQNVFLVFFVISLCVLLECGLKMSNSSLNSANKIFTSVNRCLVINHANCEVLLKYFIVSKHTSQKFNSPNAKQNKSQ